MTAEQKAEEAVDALYHYKDHYLEINGKEKGHQKNDDVQKKMQSTLEYLESLNDEITNRAVYFMLKGKILNVLPVHDPNAEEALSKAVKLDPKLVGAWNQLGECYWKSGNINSSINSFSGALNHSKNKVSLRNLSMVLRQMPGSQAQRLKMVQESLDKAKEAVQLDVNDGISWMILANAHLSIFFASGVQNPESLTQCMKAYKQAEKDPVARTNADLHYNRAMAYKYQEEYQSALDGFDSAAWMDPSWPEPRIKEQELMSFLRKTTELTETKGKLKGKKLSAMVEKLKEADLGPYSGGSYTSQKGKVITLNKCPFSELVPGKVNHQKVILGRVVCSVSWEDPVPFTFCMVDEAGTCIAVNVYNIAQGAGVKVWDSVAIPEPFLQEVKVNHKDLTLDYTSIRVDTPVVLVVNGRKLGLDKQAPTMLVNRVCDA
ncbi:tetratricopeptide repeat protein 5-like [Pecten maximus]|uniref:tetratricopeptide repeat protein 5-like n=1 Tax=Pecten maximus TaxID=6579 RepID=UPI001458A1CB|nr:tetratricopeptide repeat protein 5-like [Pecten maximus]